MKIMTTITNLKELEEREILQLGDYVEFITKEKIVKYIVQYDFLLNKEHKSNGKNEEIFNILEIDRYKLAEKKYGYTTDHGFWPDSKQFDYSALTRLVKELYLIIEEKETVYTKFTRFEIMEI